MTGVSGLQRRRWTDAIDDFVQQHGHHTPRWAICLTYELSLDVLDRKVLPSLSRRGRVFRTVVLADHGALEKALTLGGSVLQRPTEGRAALNLHPVHCEGSAVFHPKLVFLRAGPHVRACYGSANLTAGGLGGHLELWTHTEETDVVAGLVHFLRKLSSSSDVVLDGPARRSLDRALLGLRGRAHPSVWSTLYEAFGDRLRRGAEKGATKTWVLSPLYATPKGLLQAKACLPSASVLLHTDAPMRLARSQVHVYKPPDPADEDAAVQAMPATLHAKTYVFETATGTYAWIGSANFTAQALTRTVARKGNVELLVRSTLHEQVWKSFKADLRKNFELTSAAGRQALHDRQPRRGPVGAVLSGELQQSARGQRLVLVVRPGVRFLVIRREKKPFRASVRHKQAIISGRELQQLLANVDVEAGRTLMLHQQVGSDWFPFVVNVPHVPEFEQGSQRSVDVLLDELLGRAPRPFVRLGGVREPEGEEAENDGDTEKEDVEEKARALDEVQHQGELDHLAIKASLLRRLVAERSGAGCDHRALEQEALRALKASCAADHWLTVRKLFLRGRG